MRFSRHRACTDSGVTSGYRGIRRRSILCGGDGIPERQQPNQARYSDGDCFSGMFAAGLILYIAVKPDVHLDHILFGDMLGITIGDIIQTVIIAGLVTLVISVKWRDFCCSALIINRRRQAVCIRDGCIMGCCAWSPDHCGDAESGWYHSLYFSSHCARCHCGTPDTTLSYCAPAGDWHIDIGLNDWCLAVLFIDSAPAPTIVVLFAVMFIMTFTVTSINARTKENAEPRDLLSSD